MTILLHIGSTKFIHICIHAYSKISFIYTYVAILCIYFIGYLCGKCRGNAGVSALLNKCVSCGNVNILLIIALGMSAN